MDMYIDAVFDDRVQFPILKDLPIQNSKPEKVMNPDLKTSSVKSDALGLKFREKIKARLSAKNAKNETNFSGDRSLAPQQFLNEVPTSNDVMLDMNQQKIDRNTEIIIPDLQLRISQEEQPKSTKYEAVIKENDISRSRLAELKREKITTLLLARAAKKDNFLKDSVPPATIPSLSSTQPNVDLMVHPFIKPNRIDSVSRNFTGNTGSILPHLQPQILQTDQAAFNMVPEKNGSLGFRLRNVYGESESISSKVEPIIPSLQLKPPAAQHTGLELHDSLGFRLSKVYGESEDEDNYISIKVEPIIPSLQLKTPAAQHTGLERHDSLGFRLSNVYGESEDQDITNSIRIDGNIHEKSPKVRTVSNQERLVQRVIRRSLNTSLYGNLPLTLPKTDISNDAHDIFRNSNAVNGQISPKALSAGSLLSAVRYSSYKDYKQGSELYDPAMFPRYNNGRGESIGFRFSEAYASNDESSEILNSNNVGGILNHKNNDSTEKLKNMLSYNDQKNSLFSSQIIEMLADTSQLDKDSNADPAPHISVFDKAMVGHKLLNHVSIGKKKNLKQSSLRNENYRLLELEHQNSLFSLQLTEMLAEKGELVNQYNNVSLADESRGTIALQDALIVKDNFANYSMASHSDSEASLAKNSVLLLDDKKGSEIYDPTMFKKYSGPKSNTKNLQESVKADIPLLHEPSIFSMQINALISADTLAKSPADIGRKHSKISNHVSIDKGKHLKQSSWRKKIYPSPEIEHQNSLFSMHLTEILAEKAGVENQYNNVPLADESQGTNALQDMSLVTNSFSNYPRATNSIVKSAKSLEDKKGSEIYDPKMFQKYSAPKSRLENLQESAQLLHDPSIFSMQIDALTSSENPSSITKPSITTPHTVSDNNNQTKNQLGFDVLDDSDGRTQDQSNKLKQLNPEITHTPFFSKDNVLVTIQLMFRVMHQKYRSL